MFSKHANEQAGRSKEFFALYKSLGLDALISPGLPNPAVLHGQSKELAYGCAYTFLFNVLDMPTSAIPITKVREDEQTGYKDDVNGDDIFTTRVKKCMQQSAGLPVGIQVSTLPFEDEKCLAVSRLIEASLKLEPEILAEPKAKKLGVN